MTFFQSLLLPTNPIQLNLIRFKQFISIFITLFLVSCGGGGQL